MLYIYLSYKFLNKFPICNNFLFLSFLSIIICFLCDINIMLNKIITNNFIFYLRHVKIKHENIPLKIFFLEKSLLQFCLCIEIDVYRRSCIKYLILFYIDIYLSILGRLCFIFLLSCTKVSIDCFFYYEYV